MIFTYSANAQDPLGLDSANTNDVASAGSNALESAQAAGVSPGSDGSALGDIRDIFEPQAPPSNWDWWPYLLAAVIAFGALWALWKLWIWLSSRERPKSKTAPTINAPTPKLDPAEKAKRRIQEAFSLLSQPAPYCVEVSGALRVYLEERLALKAPERTTEEFLQEIRWSNRLHADQKERLEKFLELCDLVKFAKQNPDRNSLSELGDVATALIQEIEREEQTESSQWEHGKGGQG